MLQRWVRRSSRAVVIFGSPNTVAHSPKLRDLGRVAHTMKLEAQGTDDADLEARIDAYIRDVLRERDLWEEP